MTYEIRVSPTGRETYGWLAEVLDVHGNVLSRSPGKSSEDVLAAAKRWCDAAVEPVKTYTYTP